MEIVVNEWLPEWLAPTGTDIQHRNALIFLEKFCSKDDIIVVKYDSAFTDKLLKYPKFFSGYPEHARKLSFVISQILYNSNKCRLLYENELLPLPMDVLNLLTGQANSDTYLFEAAFTSTDKIIITTDDRLIVQTQNNGHIRVIHFDEFMAVY